ncbi:MAG: ankyrin repeat domain-containing protein [Phycisphaeraceae bacterium]|nr:ankyrin repeat domain-containing protein [Phycisphaerales bacterium]MCB9860167.1 ankyrin repeat domain-containing protein [Phycisphaeraceae bacterium]
MSTAKQGNSGILALGVLVLCFGGVVFLGVMTNKKSAPNGQQPGSSETPLVNRPVVVTPAPELNTPTTTTEGDRVATNTHTPANTPAQAPVLTTTQRIAVSIKEGDRSVLKFVLSELPSEVIDQPFVAPDYAFDGMTPLSIAASFGDYSTVMEVLDRGADPAALNDNGTTSLMEAVQHITSTRDGVIRAILETGPDVDARAPNGDNALMIASRMGNAQAITDLLEAGADPNATNAMGKTPLMIASETSTFDCVLLLLNGGANVNMVDNNGRTASELALERGGEAGNMIVVVLDEASGV